MLNPFFLQIPRESSSCRLLCLEGRLQGREKRRPEDQNNISTNCGRRKFLKYVSNSSLPKFTL